MPVISPTAEGFRAAFRRPSLALGEIAWRWVIGVTATVLFCFGLYQYLNSLPVTGGELLFLRSRQPYLVAQAIAHILRGSLSRVVLTALVAAFLLGILWMIAGAIGRIATVGALLDYFGRDPARRLARPSFSGLVRLNFLRVVVALAAIIGLAGASIVAGFVSPETNPQPELAFLLFLPLAALVWLAWAALNWLLSLAGLFAVRDGDDAVAAISAAVGFCRERTGAVAAVSTWTGLAHLTALIAATTAVSMPLGFAGLVPGRLVLLATMLIAVAYFALADWLYMARLAGYVCIVETPAELMRPARAAVIPPPALPPIPPSPAIPVQGQHAGLETTALTQEESVQTSIDRDELILSDTPDVQTPRDREE